jgi:hypothetical protein
MKLKIKEAFMRHELNTGKNIKNKFSEIKWPNSNKIVRKQNMNRLLKGETNATAETIALICDMTGASPNDLFGWEKSI